MRKPAYVFAARPFFRMKNREQATLESYGFSPNRRSHGRHGARVFFSGILSLPIDFGARRLSAIHIRSPYGRFGNQYIQLVHAVALAHRLKIKVVLAPGNTVFPQNLSPLHLNGVSLINDPQSVNWEKGNDAPKVSLAWPSLHLAYNTFFAGGLEELEVPLSSEEIDFAIEKIRGKWEEPIGPPLGTDHLVIHLRSGDIFSPRPHPNYGQPPLAFYEKILEHGEWSRVTLVKQDDNHPLEELISETVRSAGLDLQIQSGTFEQDFAFLRSASTIVASRGTFVSAIAGLSPFIQRIFSFGPIAGIHSSVQTVSVGDFAGAYWSKVCEGNWANSPEQVALMKSYPKENLQFLEIPTS